MCSATGQSFKMLRKKPSTPLADYTHRPKPATSRARMSICLGACLRGVCPPWGTFAPSRRATIVRSLPVPEPQRAQVHQRPGPLQACMGASSPRALRSSAQL